MNTSTCSISSCGHHVPTVISSRLSRLEPEPPPLCIFLQSSEHVTMRCDQLSVALAAAFSLLLWGAEAARPCANTPYGWRISDVRFDTAAPPRSGAWTGA